MTHTPSALRFVSDDPHDLSAVSSVAPGRIYERVGAEGTWIEVERVSGERYHELVADGYDKVQGALARADLLRAYITDARAELVSPMLRRSGWRAVA